MLKVYGLELSFPVNRVRLCVNALGLEHEFVRVNPLAGETRNDNYLKLNPTGKIPAIDDNGFTLFESNAIMKYLCRKHGSAFYPEDIQAQANVDKWLDLVGMHLGSGVAKVLFNKVLAGMIGADVDEQSLKDGNSFVERFLTTVDQQLGEHKFLAGDTMTIADFCLLATIDPVEVIDVDINDYPNVKSWRDKLMQESFYTSMHRCYGDVLAQMQSA